MLVLAGVYVGEAASSARFRWLKAPTSDERTQLTHTIAHRLARYLERQGLLVRDAEHSYLALESSDEEPMGQLRGCSMHIIACIEDSAVISKILNHLAEKSPLNSGVQSSNPRAPPQASLWR